MDCQSIIIAEQQATTAGNFLRVTDERPRMVWCSLQRDKRWWCSRNFSNCDTAYYSIRVINYECVSSTNFPKLSISLYRMIFLAQMRVPSSSKSKTMVSSSKNDIGKTANSSINMIFPRLLMIHFHIESGTSSKDS